MKEVYVLGAGFSKSFSDKMPLLKDLTELLSENTKKKIRENVALDIIFRKEKNVEKLLSYLSVNYPWKNQAEILFDHSLYLNIISDISFELLLIQSELNYEIGENDITFQLFNYWYLTKTTLVTFNYDNILEKTFSTMFGHQDWYYFYNSPIKSISDRSEPKIFQGTVFGGPQPIKKVPKILKLHGSINWLFHGNFSDKDNENVYHYDPFVNTESINRQGLCEYIIPPSLEKSNYINHSLMRCIWQNAKEEITKAEKIVFIGYSFPPSDIYMDLFIKSAVNHEQKIVVVDLNDSKEYQKRVRAIFTPIFKRSNLRLSFFTGDKALDNYIVEQIIKKNA